MPFWCFKLYAVAYCRQLIVKCLVASALKTNTIFTAHFCLMVQNIYCKGRLMRSPYQTSKYFLFF